MSDLNFPITVTSDADRYEYLYAAFEAVRLKHDEKMTDLSAAGDAHREKCLQLLREIKREIWALRGKVGTPGWTRTALEEDDPKLMKAMDDGRAAHATVDIKNFTGVTL